MAGRASEAQVQKLLGEHPPEQQEIEQRLRELVFDVMPDGEEVVDMGNKLLAYTFGPRLRDFTFALIAHKAHVNVQFPDGVDLDDPDGLVEGTGKRIRHVKVRSMEDVDRPALRKLMERQVQLRRSAGS
jgi:hypothetical protein